MPISHRAIPAIALSVVFSTPAPGQQSIPAAITNAAGLRLVVDGANVQPVVRILLPGSAESDRTIEVIFPEHVTGRSHERPS